MIYCFVLAIGVVLFFLEKTLTYMQGYIFWPSPPGGGEFLSKLKNREEFERGLEKKERKRGEKKKTMKKVIKHTLKYLYED